MTTRAQRRAALPLTAIELPAHAQAKAAALALDTAGMAAYTYQRYSLLLDTSNTPYPRLSAALYPHTPFIGTPLPQRCLRIYDIIRAAAITLQLPGVPCEVLPPDDKVIDMAHAYHVVFVPMRAFAALKTTQTTPRRPHYSWTSAQAWKTTAYGPDATALVDLRSTRNNVWTITAPPSTAAAERTLKNARYTGKLLADLLALQAAAARAA